MNNHYAAVEDCKRAIDMDPAYGKAYGRMGLAYACVDKHKEAIECFKKAIELEPENESYKSNMKLAQDKLSAAGGISTGPQPGGFPGKYHHIFSRVFEFSKKKKEVSLNSEFLNQP